MKLMEKKSIEFKQYAFDCLVPTLKRIKNSHSQMAYETSSPISNTSNLLKDVNLPKTVKFSKKIIHSGIKIFKKYYR